MYAELSADVVHGDVVEAKNEGNVKVQTSTSKEGSRVYTDKITLIQKQSDALKSSTIVGTATGTLGDGDKAAILTIKSIRMDLKVN